MTNEEFDIILKNAFESNPDFNIFDFEYDFTPAKISRKTDRYVKKLAKEMFCSPSKTERKQRVRLRYLVAALIGASVLSVGAYAYCSKYVFTMGDAKMEYISIQSSVDDKTGIEEVYELTYNLDGYKLTSYSERESGVSTCYEKGTHLIVLSQCLICSDDTAFDTEDAIIETIEINGEEAIYIDSSCQYGDWQVIVWAYDGYEFHLSAGAEAGRREFSKEQVIEMAQTIQIRE